MRLVDPDQRVIMGLKCSLNTTYAKLSGKWKEVPKWSGVTVSQLIYDSTIPLLPKSEISCSLAAQTGMCQTRSETPKTGSNNICTGMLNAVGNGRFATDFSFQQRLHPISYYCNHSSKCFVLLNIKT